MKDARLACAALSVVLLAALSAGCSSTSVPATGDLAIDLHHPDPRIRAQAAKGAVLENRLDLVPQVVENLSDRDGAVRMFAGLALRKLTGQDFGFDANGTAGERQQAIQRWRDWLATQERWRPVGERQDAAGVEAGGSQVEPSASSAARRSGFSWQEEPGDTGAAARIKGE